MMKTARILLASWLALAVALAAAISPAQAAEDAPRRYTLAKIGDSITAAHEYLWAVGEGRLQPGDYPELAEVPGEWYGLDHQSIAAIPGATSKTVVDPQFNNDPNCQPGESRVVCEYRLMRPDLAIIMIGTNDGPEAVANGWYETYLRDIVAVTQAAGITPVLSTIPYNINWDTAPANDVIRRVAAERGVMLMDYRAAMDQLPNFGLSEDGVHPSIPIDGAVSTFDGDHLAYGYTVRNLITLQILHRFAHPTNPPSKPVQPAARQPEGLPSLGRKSSTHGDLLSRRIR